MDAFEQRRSTVIKLWKAVTGSPALEVAIGGQAGAIRRVTRASKDQGLQAFARMAKDPAATFTPLVQFTAGKQAEQFKEQTDAYEGLGRKLSQLTQRAAAEEVFVVEEGTLWPLAPLLRRLHASLRPCPPPGLQLQQSAGASGTATYGQQADSCFWGQLLLEAMAEQLKAEGDLVKAYETLKSLNHTAGMTGHSVSVLLSCMFVTGTAFFLLISRAVETKLAKLTGKENTLMLEQVQAGMRPAEEVLAKGAQNTVFTIAAIANHMLSHKIAMPSEFATTMGEVAVAAKTTEACIATLEKYGWEMLAMLLWLFRNFTAWRVQRARHWGLLPEGAYERLSIPTRQLLLHLGSMHNSQLHIVKVAECCGVLPAGKGKEPVAFAKTAAYARQQLGEVLQIVLIFCPLDVARCTADMLQGKLPTDFTSLQLSAISHRASRMKYAMQQHGKQLDSLVAEMRNTHQDIRSLLGLAPAVKGKPDSNSILLTCLLRLQLENAQNPAQKAAVQSALDAAEAAAEAGEAMAAAVVGRGGAVAAGPATPERSSAEMLLMPSPEEMVLVAPQELSISREFAEMWIEWIE